MRTILAIQIFVFSLGAFAQMPTNGLVAYYPFNSNVNDSTLNNFHGVNYGATLTYDRFGNINSAYHFNGATSYIILNNNVPIITSNEFSVSCWAKIDGTSGGLNNQGAIFTQRDDNASLTASSTILIEAEENSNARFLVRSDLNFGASYEEVVTPSPAFNTWHHYVALLGSDDTMRLYIDAVEVGKRLFDQTGDFHTSIDHVNIGCHRHTGGSLRGVFQGDIDDMRIYNRSLNRDEIYTLFNESAGIEQLTKSNIIQISPNPTTGIVNVTTEFIIEDDLFVEIFSSEGKFIERKVLISNTTQTQIKCTNYTAGKYWLLFYNNKEPICSKELIIQK